MPRAAYIDASGRCYRIDVVSDLIFAPGAIDGTNACVGDTWDGSTWARPVARRSAPHEVTMRQARRALHVAGLLSAVDAAIASLPEPQRTAAAIDWEFSSTVRRDNPTFSAVSAALGLSSDQLDGLFISASEYT